MWLIILFVHKPMLAGSNFLLTYILAQTQHYLLLVAHCYLLMRPQCVRIDRDRTDHNVSNQHMQLLSKTHVL